MADRANQHYVPKFYFRYFSENGKSISLLRRDTGAIVANAPIRGQASKRYFYGNVEIEGALSKMESHFSRALGRLKTGGFFEELATEDFVLTIQSIMLQKSRTMSARKKSKEMQDRLLQPHMECAVNNDESLPEETKVEFRKIAQILEANPVQYQGVEMSIAVECAEGLLDLLPIVLRNKTNRPFIFGDSPVVFLNPHMKNVNLRGVLGAQIPGLIVLYPLDEHHCIMLIDEARYHIKRLHGAVLAGRALADVASINKLQIHNASNAVYFGELRYSQYIAELWRQEKSRLRDHRGNVVEAPGIDQYGEPMGDILHAFEPQLPFIPRFSFLEYQELPEEEYRFSRRAYYA